MEFNNDIKYYNVDKEEVTKTYLLILKRFIRIRSQD